jgi:hypothetical protein
MSVACRRELNVVENHWSQTMRECSRISDVVECWTNLIVTMVATLVCRADHVAHDALIHAREVFLQQTSTDH